MPRIALVQQFASQDRGDNIARGLESARKAIKNGAELIAFAELSFDPFFPRTPAGENLPLSLAETIPGPTTDEFCELAADHNVVFVLNIYEREGEEAYDSSPVINGDGSLLGVTRMLHIAEMPSFHEKSYYLPGDCGMPVYNTTIGRVGVAICYDRHYPEVMRTLALQNADLVVIPQAGAAGEWPDGLYEAEVQVASFQNGYFSALVNRVGVETDLTFSGESFVCSPSGEIIKQAPAGKDSILYADLDFSEIAESHARRLFMRDRRPELYPRLHTPPSP